MWTILAFSVLSYEYYLIYNVIFSCKEVVTDFDYVVCVRIVCRISFIKVGFLGALSSSLLLSLLFCVLVSWRSSVNEKRESMDRIFISLFTFFEECSSRLFSVMLFVFTKFLLLSVYIKQDFLQFAIGHGAPFRKSLTPGFTTEW